MGVKQRNQGGTGASHVWPFVLIQTNETTTSISDDESYVD